MKFVVLVFGVILAINTRLSGTFPAFSELEVGQGIGDGLEPPEEKEAAGAFQSDMLLILEQVETIWRLVMEARNGEQTRRADTFMQYRWPRNVLPYEIDPSSEADLAAIQLGMDIWSQNSCVRFVPYSPEYASEVDHDNRVLFYQGSGCSSYVGMLGVGMQEISIGVGCTNPGTIAHEIGHTLGMHHEQSRIDRDDYITIHEENIISDKTHNFLKYDALAIDTFDVAYDVRSIMHYGTHYYSANGKPTIVAHNILDHYFMGNREGFTFYDAKMANIMYNCSDGCFRPPECQNEGFVGKDCVCICKPGYTGNWCEIYSPQQGLGCVYVMIEPTGTITSPGYPRAYPNGRTCLWEIWGPEGSTITISFTAFKLGAATSCVFDRVVIQEGDDVIFGASRYCGPNLPPDFESTGNHVMLIFKSYYYEAGAGFQATYVISGPLPSTIGTATTEAARTTTTPPTTRPATTTAPPTTRPATTTIVPPTTRPATTTVPPTTHPATTTAPSTTRPATTTAPPTTRPATTTAPPTTRPATTTAPPTTRPATTTAPLIARTVATVDTDENCESVVGSCGGTFSGSGCIASPNYGQGTYDNYERCAYDIQVDPGHRVELIFLYMDVEFHRTCSYDKVEIDAGDKTHGSLKLCGNILPFGSLVSMTDSLRVQMLSDGSVTKKGFAAKFRSISIG